MSGWAPRVAAAKKTSDLEICRRLAQLVPAGQVGMEEADWRAFCARMEGLLAPAPEAAATAGRVIINIDGAARGNPGPAAIGVVIADSAGLPLRECGECIGRATNNVAEYSALIRSLELARELGVTSLEVRSDSELMVKQMNGLYRVKNEQLLPLYQAARQACHDFDAVLIVHVPRSRNRRADQLANIALDSAAHKLVP